MARINGNSRANVLKGKGDGDVIQGFGGDDKLYGYGGNDVLYGGDGKDILLGGAGQDTLYGGSGKDTLRGGSGADVLVGGGGPDRLFGGDGGDGFVFTSLADDGGRINGIIKDFSRGEGDYIRLSGIDANPNKAGDQAFKWLGYDKNGGPDDAGQDKAGVSFWHTKVDDAWITVVNMRSVDDAGYNDPQFFSQFWIEGKVDLQASDFIL